MNGPPVGESGPASLPRLARASLLGSSVRALASTLAIALIVPLAILAPAMTLLIAVGLLPTVVAWVTRRPEQRYLVQTVGAMNVAAVVPAAFQLADSGPSSPGPAGVLLDPVVWAGLYGAAATGWGIYLTVPPLVQSFTRRSIDRQLRVIENRQRELVREWGTEVEIGGVQKQD